MLQANVKRKKKKEIRKESEKKGGIKGKLKTEKEKKHGHTALQHTHFSSTLPYNIPAAGTQEVILRRMQLSLSLGPASCYS